MNIWKKKLIERLILQESKYCFMYKNLKFYRHKITFDKSNHIKSMFCKYFGFCK